DLDEKDQSSGPLRSQVSAGELIVIGAGKMGKVFAWNSSPGQALRQVPVGKHLNDVGPLPKKPVKVCPGDFGGVETPMAQSGGTVFVPWLNLCAVGSATSETVPPENFGTATGGLTAIDAPTGKVKWTRRLPHANF